MTDQMMRQGWESEARNWASFARTPGHDGAHQTVNLPALLDLLPAPAARTLDLACGEGRISRTLSQRGYRVAGVDASPTMLRFAASHQDAQPAVRGDATRLPFRDQTFDLVVAYMCLHDIDDMPRAVAEASRVLRPGGRLCAAIPHPLSTAGSFQSRDATAPFVITGSYLDVARSNWTSERGGVRLTFHSEHRPLEAYVQALADAALLTDRIREVRVPDEVVARDPAAGRWQRIPMLLHLRAIKAG